MTDNRTTELCKLLEERGVSYQTNYLHTIWLVGPRLYDARSNFDGTLTVDNLTPEQAVAVTLGSEREKALEELVRDLWHEMLTCPDYADLPRMTNSICERVRNLDIEV